MIIYVDGSAHPNPGPGGYGVVVLDNNEKILYTYSKQYEKTTNNEQELKAILYTMINYGVKENCAFDKEKREIPVVYSDSAYAINCLTNWAFGWEKNEWRKSDKKVPENLEIIQVYFNLYKQGYRIDLRKIKGHGSDIGNILADYLATGRIDSKEIKSGNNIEKYKYLKP